MDSSEMEGGNALLRNSAGYGLNNPQNLFTLVDTRIKYHLKHSLFKHLILYDTRNKKKRSATTFYYYIEHRTFLFFFQFVESTTFLPLSLVSCQYGYWHA